LVEAGVDVHRIFQALYASIDFIKFKLIGKASERAQVLEGGRLVISYLERSDFTELGAAEAYAEGVIDSLRAIDGAEMVALIREPPRSDDAPARKVSLRSSVDEIDVSAIARKAGGGGHRQAAGFSSDESVEEIANFIHREFRAAAGT
jgi:phosphoesterase RecJ-like protein